MKRLVENRVWLLLVGLAVALTVACSSSDDSSSGTDSGNAGAGEPAADAHTGG